MRGGILDVFPPTEDHPVRVEFWGDTVEEIRWFKVADQRSLEVAVHGLWAPPCRELLLTDEVRDRAAALVDRLPGAADILTRISEGIAVEGMESLAPALVDGMETVLDVLPPGAAIAFVDPERIRTRSHDLVATSQEFLEAGWANAASGNAVPIDLQQLLGTSGYRTLAELAHARRRSGPAVVGPHAVRRRCGVRARPSSTRARSRRWATAATSRPRSPTCAGWLADGWRVLAVAAGPGSAKRFVEVLGEHDVAARLDSPLTAFDPGVVHVTTGALGRGFLAPAARLAVLTEADLTGQAGTALDRGHAANAVASPQPGRPPPAPAGRLRRPRAARRRQVRRDGPAHRRRRDARVPRSSSTPRASAGSRGTGSTCRPTSSTR